MATILPVHQTVITDLYVALFDRAPDASGLAFWAQAYADGASLATITQGFIRAPEGREIYPADLGGSAFVAEFYQTVFGRLPDAQGLAFWTAALDSAGGAGSDAARAFLVEQITQVVSTALTTRPEGMSEIDFAQTVSDRAVFGNKVEVGLYFAVTLGSNDVSLAARTLAQVTQDPASVQAGRDFADQGGIVVPPTPPVPTLSISQADTAADITAKFDAYTATIARVDATGMDGAQLSAVAAAKDKIAAGGISGLDLLLGDPAIVATVAGDLLSKASGATVDASGASVDEIAAVSGFISSVADGGLRGELALTQALAPAGLGGLLAKYAGSTATVDATGMTAAQLLVLAGSIAKLVPGGILGMSLALGAPEITDTAAAALLSGATDAVVDVTGITATKLVVLIGALDSIAADGISGNLPIASATGAADIVALFAAYAGTTATVNAGDMSAAQLLALAGAIDKIATGAVTQLSLVLGDASIDDAATQALLSKASGARVDMTGASAAEVATVVTWLANIEADGITGAPAMDRSLAAADIATLLAAYAGSTATINAAGMDTAQLLAVAGNAVKLAAGGVAGLALVLSDVDMTDTAAGALLGKATDATVDATGASAASIAVLAASLAGVADGGINGALPLDGGLSAADIGALMAKYAGSTATVDALGMGAEQLAAIAASIARIDADGISGMTLPLGDSAMTDTASTALLSKASKASVDASGASVDEVAALVTALGSIAASGIGGALPIGSSLAADDITALMGKYAGSTALVDAAGMDAGQLVAAAAQSAKLGSITTLTLSLGDTLITDAITSALLDKATAASVDASGASTAEVATLASLLARIASDGISGALPLSDALSAADITALMAKYSGTTAQVDADGMDIEQLAAIAAAGAKIDGAGLENLSTTLTSSLAAADITTLLGKYAGTEASVDAAGMSNAQLSAVAQGSNKIAADGITNLSLVLNDAEIGDTVTDGLLGKASGASVDATGATANEIASLVAFLAKVNGITGALRVDSAVAASDITALMAKYTGTTAVVDADGMTGPQLAAVAAAGAQLADGGIANLLIELADANIGDAVTSTLLGKATGASVDASGASTAEIATLASLLANIATNGISGALPLSDALSAADITALMAKYSGTTARVDADGMDAEQLAAVAAAGAKIDGAGLVNLSTPLTSSLSAADITTLLGKYAGTEASIDATGMSTAQLIAVAQNGSKLAAGGITKLSLVLNDADISDTVTASLLAKASGAAVDATGATADELGSLSAFIAQVDGITGALSIGSSRAASDIVALMAKYSGTTALVDADGMTAQQLAAVAGVMSKLADGGITNLALVLADASIADSVTSALLGKAAAGTVTVNASGASTAEVATLVSLLAKVATDGISGALPLNSDLSAEDITALMAKYQGTTAQVDADGMDVEQLAAIAAAGAKIDGSGLENLSTPLTSSLAAADITTLLSKYAGTEASIDATAMSTAQLAAVAQGSSKIAANGITKLSLVLNDAGITDTVTDGLLAKASGATVDATGATAGELASLVTSISNIAANGVTGALALDSSSNAAGIAALMAKYGGTTAAVDAAGMTGQQVAAVASVVSKIADGGITNLVLVLADASVNDSVTSALLAKTTGVNIDAGGASTAEVTTLASLLANIATDGISGALPLDSSLAAEAITALMAKYSGTTARVDAAGMDTEQLAAVAAAGAKIAGAGLVNLSVSLDSSLSAADITTLLSKYAGTEASIDATAMSTAQLAAVAQGSSKIAANGITNLSLVLSEADITDTVTDGLLAKASGATVVATGATASEFASLAASIAGIAANGITGTLALDSSTDAAGIAALMAKYAGSSATVNASGMVAAQHLAVSQAAGKLAAGGIGNLSLALGDASITDAATTALLGKATNATVDASSASENEVVTLVASLANVAANGITGALAVGNGVGASSISTLFAKYNGTTATVNASGMSEAQLLAIAGVTGKLAAGGITNLSLVLANANITDSVTAALVGKASGASVNATGATNAEVATLAASVGNIAANGITGNLPLTSATAGADISALMAKYGGTTTAVNAQSMNLEQLQALAAASGKIGVNGISDLFVRSSESALTDADFSTLLGKSAAAFASFDAVNASTARLQLVADNISRFFDTGIIGTLNLNSQFSATQLSALTSAKVQVAARVSVDAAGMTTAQLVALAANASKVDTLSNVQALALGDAAMTATYANYLLSAGTGATVVATGASEANVQRLFNQLSKVADQGISGVLPLTAAQFNATSAGTLDPKLAASASVAVTGSASDETFNIGNYTHAVTIAAGDGRDTLIVSGTSLLGAGVASTAFTGMDVLQLKGTATAYMSKVAGVTELSIDPATGPIEVREITAAQAQNLKILNGTGASIALYLDGAATSTTDIVKATVSTTNPGGGGQPVDLTGITLPDVEGLELTSNGNVARGVLTLTTANARALTSIKVVNNGDSFITVDAAHTGSGLVIDGRGAARTVIDASAYAPASGVTIYGGVTKTSNPSKLNGSAGADVIVGGAGDDIIAGDGVYRAYAGLGEVQTFAFSGDTGVNGGLYTLGGYLLTRPGGATTASLATLINNGIVQVLEGNPDVANAVFSATQVVVTFKVKAGDVAPLANSFVNYGSDGKVDPSITPTLTAGPSVQTRAYDPAVSFATPAAFASADTLTGGEGMNTFAFALNSSTVTAYDTITDLKLGGLYSNYIDTLIFVNPNGTTDASVLSGQAQTDVMAAGSLAAAVNLALSSAASDGYTLQFTYGTDTWLLHNGDGNAVFNDGADYLVKITGVTGTLDLLDMVLG